MTSLKEIRAIRIENCIVIMSLDTNGNMRDMLDRSPQGEEGEAILYQYKGVEFLALPSGKMFVSFEDLKKNKSYLLK